MEELFEKLRKKLNDNFIILMLVIVGLLGSVIFYFYNSGQKSKNTIDSTNLSVAQSVSSFDNSEANMSSSKKAEKIIVDVKGAVKDPNIYTVSSDLRINDVIQLAGGFTEQADQKSVNLAAKIKDEEVIYVASIGENGVSVIDGAIVNQNSITNDSGKVNINTADATKLQTLNGIGEKKAQDIIDYRTQNGSFKSIEELKNVSGFGDKIFAKLKDSIEVK